jgi:glyoxylase-like metal-dependent hydrolase (beta-lactamase superfamily II)
MQYIEQGVFYEDLYLGVTLGALVFNHGTIMIDAPLRTEDARSWRSMLINQRGGPNRLLINLDAHPDRTLGARVMDTTIIAHKETAEVFNQRPIIFKGSSVETGAVWESYPDAVGLRWASPDITFSRRISIHWGEAEVILQHRPGPTSGSIWVIIPDLRVVFIGDTVLINQPPFLADADIDAWLRSIDLLIEEFHDYVIISSRGGAVELKDLKKQKRILLKIAKRLDGYEKRNAEPESVKKLVKPLLSDYSGNVDLREQYSKRLYYGLLQYYLRSNRTVDDLDRYVGSRWALNR